METEPEFDRFERAGWEQLDEYQAAVCQHCGNLRSVCSDPDVTAWPQRSYCYITALRMSVERRMTHHYEKAPKPGPGSGWTHPQDGVTYWMSLSDLTPGDTFDGAFPAGATE